MLRRERRLWACRSSGGVRGQTATARIQRVNADGDGLDHPGSFNSVAPPLRLTAWRLGARALPELSARR